VNGGCIARETTWCYELPEDWAELIPHVCSCGIASWHGPLSLLRPPPTTHHLTAHRLARPYVLRTATELREGGGTDGGRGPDSRVSHLPSTI